MVGSVGILVGRERYWKLRRIFLDRREKRDFDLIKNWLCWEVAGMISRGVCKGA
jgi:hypothetical protein